MARAEPTDSLPPTRRFSVCVATRGRPELFESFLESLQNQEGAPSLELLVCCQGDAQNAALVNSRFPEATVGFVEHAYPGGARNFLIERARGEVLVFLDDDVTFDDHMLETLDRIIERHPEAAVFGGPNLTPPGSTRFQFIQGAVLASIVGAGPVRRRYGRHPRGHADERFFTLCNMAVRRNEMVTFPVTLPGGEENAALAALARQGAVMIYDPDFVVYHARRERYGAFARQMVKYGRGRGSVILGNIRSCRAAHLAPVALLVWLCSLPVLSVLWTPWWLLSLAVYAGALIANGLKIAMGMPDRSIPVLLEDTLLGAGLIATVHACYGTGVLRGLFSRPSAPPSEWQSISREAVVIEPPPDTPQPSRTLT